MFNKLEFFGLNLGKNRLQLDIFEGKNKINQFFNQSTETIKKSKLKVGAGTKFSKEVGLQPYLQLFCPNLFNRNVTLKMSYLPPKSSEFNLVFPFRSKESLELNFASKVKNFNKKYVSSRMFSFDYKSVIDCSIIYEIIENATKFFYITLENKEESLLHFKTKTGAVSGSFFSRFDLYLKKYFELPMNLFYRMKIHLGTIYGHPHEMDRYFLGNGIRGYLPGSISPLHANERIGGKSCLEISNNIGFSKGIFKFFIFNDIGFSSRQNNLFETIESAIKSVFISFRPASFGISNGIGLSVNLTKTKTYSLDLTASYGAATASPSDKRPFNIGIDLDVL
ncbi:putative Bacterial surface antigen (D15) protein [Pseudoloma neurophilia]|uniref:Putative Bacterial surface antigen (D15) protein n=1 Tax=Pseudoloma neurophilia TaxID=146866 RepID=A0A0R0LYU7_9MICR|nr:putative Bacterial surface antigen (D15) protein [Pseudoloma neurophilia]